MKKNITQIIGIIFMLYSCSESEFVTFKSETFIQFQKGEDIISYYSFVFEPSEILQDTVYVRVTIIGNPVSYDRVFDIVQIDDVEWEYQYDVNGNIKDSVSIELKQAVPGKHYRPLNKEDMVIKADSIGVELPLVFLRDKTLEEDEYRLRLKLKEEGDFILSEDKKIITRLCVADILVPPSLWLEGMMGDYVKNYILGEYSRVKHRFMIDISGLQWTNEDVDDMLNDYAKMYYYNKLFYDELAKLNNRNGKPLVDEYGKEISFPLL